MLNTLNINPGSEDVWTTVCNNCGWHSDICAAMEGNLCPNCGQEDRLLQIIGDSEEIGNYFMGKLKQKR